MTGNYKQIYETKGDYDVIIYAGEEPNTKEIHAHSFVLRNKSAYFRGAFTSGWAVKDQNSGCFTFKKPNISPSIFEIILKFLYCGDVEIKDLKGETILELLVASDEFGLTTLIDHVQQYFIENQKNFLQKDPVGMLHIASLHEAFNKIEEFSLEFICENPEILFDSNNKYLSLEENILIMILKHDGLDMDEIEIWKRVVKWGISQNTGLKDDVTKFNQEDFELLEKTLRRCIQYIRFHDISMPDFYQNVLPYFSILPKNLYDDILRCYMAPYAVPLYNAFPSRFDWDMSNQNKHSSDSFIFSFLDSNNVSNNILGRISSSYTSDAIRCFSNRGPDFGDLYINGNYVFTSFNGYYNGGNRCYNCGNNCAGHPSILGYGVNQIQIENYEVFQVIKK
ncbi:8400_t:CDS:2 [Scutellospora calospora]|uniref:8400_t:CDS:1 n=1 Tax=Scutellospora calospora TaxID=85575 RepID=A0ACA9KCC6_9GLOM|nr:8400_t:CDS:2 [Scutellospora calospora]